MNGNVTYRFTADRFDEDDEYCNDPDNILEFELTPEQVAAGGVTLFETNPELIANEDGTTIERYSALARRTKTND